MDARKGYFYALGATALWGVFPVYWKLLRAIPAAELLPHRILWSAVFFLLLLKWKGGLASFRTLLRSRRSLGILAGSGLLITSNWFLFVYAVNSGHVLEASLAYFVTPLLNVALGTAFLGERLRPAQWLAVGIAALGAAAMARGADGFPWLSLGLALTFSFYGLVRKGIRAEALPASAVETCLMSFPALAGLAWLSASGAAVAGSAPSPTRFLIVLGGAVTAIPLLWFVEAARRLPLSTLGLFQYISPTLQFTLAVFAYGEPFHSAKALGFSLIWAALALYTLDSARARRL